jgi:aminodeoxychorismate synthase component I
MLGISSRLSISKKVFLDKVKCGCIPPLYAEVPYTSAASLYPNFSGAGSFLFESVKGPYKIARYSFIGFDPYLIFKVKDGVIELSSQGRDRILSADPLKVLGGILSGYRQMPADNLPPFQGGAAGLLSYDFVRYLERVPATAVDDLKIPDAHFFLIDKLIAFDHLKKKTWIILCPGARSTGSSDWSEEFDRAEHEIAEIQKSVHPREDLNASASYKSKIEVFHEMTEKGYTEMVRRTKEYIAAGDIFQANISLRVSAFIGGLKPWNLYTVLRKINPSPFAGFVDFGDYLIVSSSPERLLLVRDRIVETRPIAGTRPRGKNQEEDNLMRAELLLNDKERAEHIMLIDLERNDIGRVCDYGTIEVDELMITEDYSHVIHIVSNIKGRLNAGRTPLDSIKAVFPGGTITGVPKVRCMEIIDELEPVRRGPYTGSMGYISFSGNVDLNIIIRSFTIKNEMAYVQAGAGIVADSDPLREYHESLKKAEALIRTLTLVSA